MANRLDQMRRILFLAERTDSIKTNIQPMLKANEKQKSLIQCVKQLLAQGYIRGTIQSDIVSITLTSDGYRLLDCIRNDDVWKHVINNLHPDEPSAPLDLIELYARKEINTYYQQSKTHQ